MNSTNCRQSRQQGAVLIISMVMLLIVTLLGLAAMETSGTQIKMSSVTRERQQALEIAEQVLVDVEEQIEGGVYGLGELQDCASGQSSCFDDTCAGGLCFDGAYTAGDDQIDCTVDSTTQDRGHVWSGDTNWASGAKHLTLSIPNVSTDPKYLVEFLCYIERGDGTSFSASAGEENNGAAYYRITARAVSNGGKAEVMLQSTYRLNGA